MGGSQGACDLRCIEQKGTTAQEGTVLRKPECHDDVHLQVQWANNHDNEDRRTMISLCNTENFLEPRLSHLYLLIATIICWFQGFQAVHSCWPCVCFALESLKAPLGRCTEREREIQSEGHASCDQFSMRGSTTNGGSFTLSPCSG